MTYDRFPQNSPQPNTSPAQQAPQTAESSSVELPPFEFDFERAESTEFSNFDDLEPFELELLNEGDDLEAIKPCEIEHRDQVDGVLNFDAYRLEAQVSDEELELNAYLDGELTDAVRQRVETLLHADATHRQRYNQLARLSRELKRLPIPPSSVTAEELADRAIAAAQERRRQSLAWGTSAVAALFLAVLSSTGIRSNFYAPDVAQTPTPSFHTAELKTAELQTPSPATTSVSQKVTNRVADRTSNSRSPLVSRALFVE